MSTLSVGIFPQLVASEALKVQSKIIQKYKSLSSKKLKLVIRKKISRHFSFSEAISEFYFEDTEAFEQEFVKTNKKYILGLLANILLIF